MKFFEATRCCFYVDDLQIAGYAIAGYVLTSITNYIAFFPSFTILIFVLYAVIWCAWIYGIYQKRPDFMLPALVLSFATLCAMVVFLIYIVIVGIYFLDAFQYQIDEFLRELQFDLKVNATHVWWGVLVIFIIYTVIQWHFTSVMCSVLKKIKEVQHSTSVAHSYMA